jgi:hypothetical protein
MIVHTNIEVDYNIAPLQRSQIFVDCDIQCHTMIQS